MGKRETILHELYICGEMMQSDLYGIIKYNSYTISVMSELRKNGLIRVISGNGVRTVRLTSAGRKKAQTLFPDESPYIAANRVQVNDRDRRYRIVRESRVLALAMNMGLVQPLLTNQSGERFLEKSMLNLSQEEQPTRCNGIFSTDRKVCAVYSMDTTIIWWKSEEDWFLNGRLTKIADGRKKCMAILSGDYRNLIRFYRKLNERQTEIAKENRRFEIDAVDLYELYFISIQDIAKAARAMSLILNDDMRDYVIRHIAKHYGIVLTGDIGGIDRYGTVCRIMPVLNLKRLPTTAGGHSRVICASRQMRDALAEILPGCVSVEVSEIQMF